MDIIIPHYPNDPEHLQIESISPQAEDEPQAEEGWHQKLQNSISTHWNLRGAIKVRI